MSPLDIINKFDNAARIVAVVLKILNEIDIDFLKETKNILYVAFHKNKNLKTRFEYICGTRTVQFEEELSPLQPRIFTGSVKKGQQLLHCRQTDKLYIFHFVFRCKPWWLRYIDKVLRKNRPKRF